MVNVVGQGRERGSVRSQYCYCWTIITEQNIKYKVLVALLYHYMERGQEMATGEQERLAIQAAGLYLVLLGLPGSGAFKIFHPVLFSKALDIFTLVSKLGMDKRSPKKKGGSKKASQRRGGRGTQASQSQQGGEDEEEEEGAVTALSQREVGKVVQGLVEVLSCLHIMLDNCSLKRSFESIEATVGSLVILTHLETTNALKYRIMCIYCTNFSEPSPCWT